MMIANFNRTVLSSALVATLVACGSGGGGGSTDTAGTMVSSGVITDFGSIVVNDVHFDESNADVVINDNPGSGEHMGLKVGMTVKIKGSFDGSSGVATDIEAEHEVEGEIASIDGDGLSFVVLGQTILTGVQTVYEGIPNGFSGLAYGMKVEIYGLRDASGNIRATLIEAEDDDMDYDEEVRGVVSDLTSDTFKIGDFIIHYDSSTEVEDGTLATDLKEGATVEVHFDSGSSMPNHATKIEFEDNEDAKFEVYSGDETEVEGYVSEYDNAAGTFKIGNVYVMTTSMTEFEGMGTLENDIKVEVEGYMSNGYLIAKEVSFENYCDGEIFGNYYDNIYVSRGDTCTLNGTEVGGNVYVEKYAALTAVNAYIEGNVQAYYPNYVHVMDMTYVGGNIQVEKAMGPSSVKESHVEGDVQVAYSNISHDVEYAWDISMNHVGGNVQFNYNNADYGMFWIYGNTIDGNLQCYDNYPAPMGGGNIVYGNAEGQCYYLANMAM